MASRINSPCCSNIAGRRAEGEAQFQDVYDRLLAVHGQDDPRTIRAASELAELREHGFVAAGRDRPELMQRD